MFREQLKLISTIKEGAFLNVYAVAVCTQRTCEEPRWRDSEGREAPPIHLGFSGARKALELAATANEQRPKRLWLRSDAALLQL